MSFIIKCDRCGNEVNLFNGDSRLGEKIQIIPDVTGHWQDGSYTIHGVDIYCENPKCNQEINLK